LVVKLKAYALQENFNGINSYNALSNMQRYGNTGVYFGSYSDRDIQNVEENYGIVGRRFWGTDSNGVRSYATVTHINFGNKIIETGQWSKGVPYYSDMPVFRLYTPFVTGLATTLDVTDNIVEGTTSITRQIESLEKFDLRASRASFSLDESTEIATFLGKYWNPDGYEGVQYLIIIDIEGYFLGISDYDNINYDEVEKTYHFDCYDPIKWLQKYVWGNRLPSLGSQFRNINGFLYATCNFFNEIGTINIDVDGSQNWDVDYVSVFDGSEMQPLDYHMTIADMIAEIMKHYGATIYFDAYGHLNFITRNKRNETDYNETVMLETLNKSYELHGYSGLIINVKGNWKYVNGNWELWAGWVLVWEEDGALQVQILDANLSSVPRNFSYLDLRQELPEKVYFGYSLGATAKMYRMFLQRTREEIYNDYKELFRSSVLYETTLDGVDYQLYDTISINGENYTMNYLQIDFNEENTQIRCYKSL